MKRPLTTNFAPPPSEPPQVEPEQPSTATWREAAPIVASLIATLEAIETGPKAGPARKAHRSSMRRQGEAAAALGGFEAMEAVLQKVGGIDPSRAEQRRTLISEAWTGLPGWRS